MDGRSGARGYQMSFAKQDAKDLGLRVVIKMATSERRSLFHRILPVFLLAEVGLLPVASGQMAAVPLATGQASPRPRQVLFLGRQVNSHHNPAAFNAMMRLSWAERNLRMRFTTSMADLNAATLGEHDALFVYGNAFAFYGDFPGAAAEIEQYANGGGGVAAMHVACWSFPNDAKWTSIVGGGFLGHYAIQEFSQVILDVDHPILEGLGTYTSVDEPYQFRDLTSDRTILTVRPGPGPQTEMTWVRPQGLGRVFYHSGGHDSRTWVQPNFQELMARGIEWVARSGDGPLVEGIDRARIGNGAAVALRVSLAGPGAESRDAVFTLQGGKWYRPVVEGDTLFDKGSGVHAPQADDVLRVGGLASVPVLAMDSGFTDAGPVSRRGWWAGRGGLARLMGQDEGELSWGSGYLIQAAPPPGIPAELVMNAGGASVARVFVTREGFPDLDTALVRAASGDSEATVLLVEGEDPGLASGPWTCGDLSEARLSLNGPGHLAAILPGLTGKRLAINQGAGWISLLATGENISGLAEGTQLEDLREVRLNDAGAVVVAARINPGGGPVGAILRRTADGAGWSSLVIDGPQPWLEAGEHLVLPPDGKGCLIDAGSTVWVLAGIMNGVSGASSRCLVKISAAGSGALVCREGGPLTWGGETVTVTALGPPEDWTCGPAGMACGRLTVTPAAGPAREVLARWSGLHVLPVLETGKVFHGATGDFTVAGFRLDGGGTAEDGKGGYLSSSGEWVAAVSAVEGGDRLLHGLSLADLDGDGREDLLEAALGGDPRAPDQGVLLGVEPVAAGAVLRYLRSMVGPYLYQIEASHDLEEWLPVAEVPVVSPDQSGVAAGFQRMELTLSETHRFARVRVTAD